jgi:thiol-disulfide isomerase/thioredoxin
MFKKMNFLSALVLMFVLFSQTSCSGDNSKAEDSGPQVLTIKTVTPKGNTKAQDFTFEKDGKTHSFLEYTKGKVVFLNFWGTWCPPCRKEIPDIIEINKELKDKDFLVIGIALERPGGDPAEKVKSYAESQGINYINFVADRSVIGQIVNAYGGIEGVPTTYIIDRNANIHRKIVGMRSKQAFMNEINPVL